MRRMWPLVLVLAGCDEIDDLLDILTETDGNLVTSTWTDTTNQEGLLSIDVDVTSDTDTFLVTAQSASLVSVERLFDPNGNEVVSYEDWSDTAESLTNAFGVEARDTVFQWPIRDVDGDLSKGTWTVEVGAYDDDYYYQSGKSIDVTVQSKSDGDFGDGTVRVVLAYADGVGSDAAAVTGVEDAVERWREVWGGYGISLLESYIDTDIDADLSFPGYGMADDFEDVSGQSRRNDFVIVIGETLDGSLDYYGVAGAIPDTLVSSKRAVIVISWLANAGGDGEFDSEDIRLFGETLAHESGHYMGLYHPVEDGWAYWDALDDTDACTNESACEAALGDNLMFPFPVCDFTSCTPQDVLTDDQQGVKHRYTGTL